MEDPPPHRQEYLQLGHAGPSRQLGIAIILACCLLLAAGIWWFSRPGPGHGMQPPHPSPSLSMPSSTAVRSSAPPASGATPTRPLDPVPSDGEMQPVGELVVQREWRGPAQVELPPATRGRSYVTVRIACLPVDSPVKVTVEATGRLIMKSTCAGAADYGAGFTVDTNTPVLNVAVAANVEWRLAVWST